MIQNRKFSISKFFQFFFGIILDLAAMSFLVFQVVSEVTLESVSQKPVSTAAISLKEEKDPSFQLVLDIFDNIESGKIQESLGQIQQLSKNKKVPKKILEYFTDFYEFYGIAQNPKIQKNSEINIDTFLKKAHYLQDYFEKTKYKDSWLGFAEIIPYYYARNFYAKQEKKQADYCAFYKSYVETICEQYQFVSSKGADLICLYLSAKYYTYHTKLELKSYVAEIEHFQEIFPNQLGDNGSLTAQAQYLKIIKKYALTKIDSVVYFDSSFTWLDKFPAYKL